ncbi:TPA: hypothetical protein DIU27_04350 [Candidatus Collierbacteria bacterium]|nr:MAG: hypothetical protein UW58_C0001G0026 [Candidatus Collierbacteria bacterium GW2011_GWC2_44_30]HCQ31584.1 hypothetical protein [Candidatus Collierbacteria bacterium]
MIKRFNSRSFVLVCAFLVFLLAVILSAVLIKQSYSGAGEPKNVYMIHLFESGMYSERMMCNTYGVCVLLRTPRSVVGVSSIEISGEKYFEILKSNTVIRSTARGMYCPGVIDLASCFEVVTIYPLTTCPTEIKYLGFRAPLVPDTCLIGE